MYLRPGLLSIVTLILLLTTVCSIRSQSLSQEYTLHSIDDSVLVLPDSFLILPSLRLRLDSTLDLRPGIDYATQDSEGVVRVMLLPNVRSLLYGQSLSGSSTQTEHHLQMTCDVFPTSLRRTYSLFAADSTNDSLAGERNTQPLRGLNEEAARHGDDHFRFSKSGGITRGVQVGSTQDATFNNSFNLTFDGALGDALEFKGALSEESTPLQPEGNTQTLRDIDRIYIELHSPHLFTATIGDFPLSLKNIRQDSILSASRYDDISRKVLGAMGAVQAGPTAVAASYSITKGQFTTNGIGGIDGVQGPYTLGGKNGEQAIIVIAGTEHVYVDGVLMTRGDQNDYIIDYGLAQITFTSKRIISSFSRITVDFEYTNEQYSRDLVAVKQSTSLFGDRINMTTTYLREGDDQNNPRELSLSDSDKQILALAGNDATKASKSGVVIVARDSNGRARGYCHAIDTTINARSVRLYQYAPFDTLNSIYNVAFGFAGRGKGQYIRRSIGDFEYVGNGNGDYDTLIFLPFPQLHQLFSGGLLIRPFDGLVIGADGAMSGLTLNRFSTLGANNAGAYTLSGEYLDTVSSAQRAFVNISGMRSVTSAAFAPFDRIRSVESMRAYGIDNTASGTAPLGEDELEQSFEIRGGIFDLSAGFNYGDYSLGQGAYSAKRYDYNLQFAGKRSIAPDITLRYRITPTTDSSIGVSSSWRTLTAEIVKTISDSVRSVTPRLSFSFADRTSTPLTGTALPDSLLGTSFRYSEFAPSLSTTLARGASLDLAYAYRTDDSARGGVFRNVSHSSQFILGSALAFANGFSGRFDVGLHTRTFTDSISSVLNGGDNTSLLLHLVPHYRTSSGALSIDADYQVSELRTAAMQRLFFAVPPGQGNYTYVGDLNANGKQDPDEFQPARFADQGTYILLTIPTDQLRPTVDLHSQFRLRLSPASLDSDNHFRVFSPLTFESFVRIEENSTDRSTSDIYFLKLSRFLNDSLTIRGLQELQQDVFLFENQSNLSFRLRWNQRIGASQFNTGLERYYHRETSLQSRIRIADEITSEEHLSIETDNVATNTFSTNRPQQTTRYTTDIRLSYDPFAVRTGYGLYASFESIGDPLYLPLGNGMINTLRLSFRYAVTSNLTLRFEIGRNEFIAHTVGDAFLPYGLSSGLVQGLTWQWSIGADQEISRGVLLNISYDGRSEPSVPERHITHTARAEIRASF